MLVRLINCLEVEDLPVRRGTSARATSKPEGRSASGISPEAEDLPVRGNPR